MNVLLSAGTRSVRSRGRGRRLLLLTLALLAFAGFGAWYATGHVPRVRRAYRRWRLDPDRYDEMIQDAANRHGVSPCFVKAVIWKESRFLPETVGGKGEVGLMQLTGGAVTEWAEAHGRPVPVRGLWFDPRLNVEMGTWYLARAMNRWQSYESMEVLALSEYNAGQTRAQRWAPADPDVELPVSGVTFPTTRAYITRILNKTRYYEQREARE
jgi:soluble lytic murein transglycosylase